MSVYYNLRTTGEDLSQRVSCDLDYPKFLDYSNTYPFVFPDDGRYNSKTITGLEKTKIVRSQGRETESLRGWSGRSYPTHLNPRVPLLGVCVGVSRCRRGVGGESREETGDTVQLHGRTPRPRSLLCWGNTGEYTCLPSCRLCVCVTHPRLHRCDSEIQLKKRYFDIKSFTVYPWRTRPWIESRLKSSGDGRVPDHLTFRGGVL